MFVCVCFVLLLPHNTYLASQWKPRTTNLEARQQYERLDKWWDCWGLLNSMVDVITVCHQGDVVGWMWLAEALIHIVRKTCSCLLNLMTNRKYPLELLWQPLFTILNRNLTCSLVNTMSIVGFKIRLEFGLQLNYSDELMSVYLCMIINTCSAQAEECL